MVALKALVLKKYGSTDDLELMEVPKPIATEDEVLVKLLYTSINAADLDYVNGHPLVRFTGLSKPGYPILGSDLVGEVEAVGSSVNQFEIGDLVWADTSNPLRYGTFAEYLTVPAKQLAKLQKNTNLKLAACLPSAGSVALQNIQLLKGIAPGKTALVNGAGGGIGNIIVQYLVSFGLEVTAVDKQVKHEMLEGIGANHTIDYEKINILHSNQQYDYVIDLVCPGDLKQAVHLTKEKGQFIMLGGSTKNIIRVLTQVPLLSKLWKRKVILGKYDTNNLGDLKQLEVDLNSGIIKPVVDRVVSIEDLIQGIKDLEKGYVNGKIVVNFD